MLFADRQPQPLLIFPEVLLNSLLFGDVRVRAEPKNDLPLLVSIWHDSRQEWAEVAVCPSNRERHIERLAALKGGLPFNDHMG